MDLQPYEIYDRATRAPAVKTRLAQEIEETKSSVSRKCRRPVRATDPCATGRVNEVEKIERTLRGLITIGQPGDADFIVNRLRCYVRECKQEVGAAQEQDSLPLLVHALESLVRAMRIKMDNQSKDFEEAALRTVGIIEDCIVGSGREQGR